MITVLSSIYHIRRIKEYDILKVVALCAKKTQYCAVRIVLSLSVRKAYETICRHCRCMYHKRINITLVFMRENILLQSWI